MRHDTYMEERTRAPDGAARNEPEPVRSARAGPPNPADPRFGDAQVCGGSDCLVHETLGAALDGHAARATRAADVLHTAGARARTAASAVAALAETLAHSEALAATMARLAQQTGRVALNASIEAGREFAVVAEALRRLAADGGAAARAATAAAVEARVEVDRAATSAHDAALDVDEARNAVEALAVEAAELAANPQLTAAADRR